MLSPEEIATFPWSQLGWLAVNEGEMEELLLHLGGGSSKAKGGEKVTYVGDLTAFGGKEKHEEKMALLSSTLEPGLLALSQHPSFTSKVGGGPNIILTLGSAGSLALLPPSEQRQAYTIIYTPSAKLQGTVRDTTGAGDCFTGFFVGGLMARETVRGGEREVEDVREALRVATQVSSSLCGRWERAITLVQETDTSRGCFFLPCVGCWDVCGATWRSGGGADVGGGHGEAGVPRLDENACSCFSHTTSKALGGRGA